MASRNWYYHGLATSVASMIALLGGQIDCDLLTASKKFPRGSYNPNHAKNHNPGQARRKGGWYPFSMRREHG